MPHGSIAEGFCKPSGARNICKSVLDNSNMRMCQKLICLACQKDGRLLLLAAGCNQTVSHCCSLLCCCRTLTSLTLWDSNIIDLVFGGMVIATNTCLSCNRTNSVPLGTRELQLPLHIDTRTLDQALQSYFANGTLSGDNAYQCEHCDRWVLCCNERSPDKQTYPSSFVSNCQSNQVHGASIQSRYNHS